MYKEGEAGKLKKAETKRKGARKEREEKGETGIARRKGK
jgi:hypothetical protein